MQNDHLDATKFTYRLAAVDLDGTLLGPDKAISEQNAAAVQQFTLEEVLTKSRSQKRQCEMVNTRSVLLFCSHNRRYSTPRGLL